MKGQVILLNGASSSGKLTKGEMLSIFEIRYGEVFF